MASASVASRGAASRRLPVTSPTAPKGKSASRGPSRSGSPVRGSSPAPPMRSRFDTEPKDVTQVFKKFDVNGDGKIDRRELMEVLQHLDPELWTDRKATLLLMSMDENFDGHIDYEEFVGWVSADGCEQGEFRDTTGMPRDPEELRRLEAQRKAAAMKGTKAEVDSKKAIADHRLEVLKDAQGRLQAARSKYDGSKVEAESVSEIYMPMYRSFKSESADASVPTKELLEHDMRVACDTPDLDDSVTPLTSPTLSYPPASIKLAARAMCSLFKVKPGTQVNTEPDYWTAFLEAVLNQKLLFQMDKFEKDQMSNAVLRDLKEVCEDECFAPEKVKEMVQNMPKCSSFVVSVCLWIHFLGKYAQAGVKRLWDQVQRAQLEMEKAEQDVTNKEVALMEVKREIGRLEGELNS